MKVGRGSESIVFGSLMLGPLFAKSIFELANVLNVFEEKTGLDADAMPEFEEAQSLIRLYVRWTLCSGRALGALPELLGRERLF